MQNAGVVARVVRLTINWLTTSVNAIEATRIVVGGFFNSRKISQYFARSGPCTNRTKTRIPYPVSAK
jgi:hypothetical protein